MVFHKLLLKRLMEMATLGCMIARSKGFTMFCGQLVARNLDIWCLNIVSAAQSFT